MKAKFFSRVIAHHSSSFIIFFFLFFQNIFGQQGNVVQQVDSAMNHLVKLKMFSGAVVIAIDNKPIYQKAFGFSDYREKLSNRLNTKFYLGNISNFFTALLIEQLNQENKINFSDTIDKFIPGFSFGDESKITILDLLNDKSGLGNYEFDKEYIKQRNNIKSISDFLPIIKSEKLKFIPGTKTSQSSSGFIILDAIIEKLYHQNIKDVLRNKIFDPLKMNESGLCIDGDNNAENALGYNVLINGEVKQSADFNYKGLAMYSTIEDLLKLDKEMSTGNTILSEEGKLRLFTRDFLAFKNANWENYSSSETFGIEGTAPGTDNIWYHFFKEKYTIIILSNFNQPAAKDVNYLIKMILFGRSYFLPNLPQSRFIYNQIKKNGMKYFLNHYVEIFRKNHYEISDFHTLDNAAQGMLQINENKWAIGLLKLNAGLFSYIPRVYNSLADAFLHTNQKMEAISNYKKTLKIDPQNVYARKMLISLGDL